MDFKDVKEYFHNYVLEYKPYKTSNVYKIFITFLIEKYFSDSYIEIPIDFKQAFEQQLLPQKFIVPFLESIGIETELISKLSISDRFKFATLLSDFHRYKGTVQLLDKLITTFNENRAISVYELYLTRTPAGIWKVLPVLLGKSPLVSSTLNTELDYSILKDAEHWYLDIPTLDNLWNNNEISLPYKTNCLKIDGSIHEDISLIVQLVSALVSETFKTEHIQLIFKDRNYATTFEKFGILWYYILHYIHSKGTFSSPFPIHNNLGPALVFGKYEIPTKTGTLPRGSTSGSIQPVLDLYFKYLANTNTATINTDIWTLFKNDIETFSGPITSIATPFDQYRATVISSTELSLIEYIDTRLSSASNLSSEVDLLFGELYSSMLTFKIVSTTTLDTSYIDYYLLSLPGYTVDISKSPFFLLFNFLKPKHADIISEIKNNTISSSLFDNGLTSYMIVMSYLFEMTTYESITDNASTIQNMAPIFDNQLALSVPAGHSVSGLSSSNLTPTTDTSGPYTYDNPGTGVHTVFLT